MPLGFAKSFIIFLLLAIALGYGTNNWWNTLAFIGFYAVVVLIWRYLTR